MPIETRGIRRFYQLPDDSGKPKCGESNTRRSRRQTKSRSASTPKFLLCSRPELHREANSDSVERACAMTKDKCGYIFATTLVVQVAIEKLTVKMA